MDIGLGLKKSNLSVFCLLPVYHHSFTKLLNRPLRRQFFNLDEICSSVFELRFRQTMI